MCPYPQRPDVFRSRNSWPLSGTGLRAVPRDGIVWTSCGQQPVTRNEQIATHGDLLHCRAEGLLKISVFSSIAGAAVLQLCCSAAEVLEC